jgi:hypothetical protein
MMAKKIGKICWLLLVMILPLTLIGAKPWRGVDASAGKSQGTFVFDPVSIESFQSMHLLLSNLRVRPGRPAFPPSPCLATVLIRNIDGDVAYSSDPLELGVDVPASFDLSRETLSTDELSTFLPAVQLTGANSRSCSGVAASMELKNSAGQSSYRLPGVAKGKKPGPPNLNLTPSNAQVLAPFYVESGQSLQIVFSNTAEVIGHGYPPSPCLPAVQFFGVMGGTYTTDGEALLPGTSFTVDPTSEVSGAADALVILGGNACRSVVVSAKIMNDDGLVAYVPLIGRGIGLTD